MADLMKGKRGLVMGVANERSIAWGIAKALADEGRTMILVTHDMKLAADVSDHVIFLHLGKIEEQGPPATLFGAPKTDRLRGFLSATGA